MYRDRDLAAAQYDRDRLLHGAEALQNRGTYDGAGTRSARHRLTAAALVYTRLDPVLRDNPRRLHVHAVREDPLFRGQRGGSRGKLRKRQIVR